MSYIDKGMITAYFETLFEDRYVITADDVHRALDAMPVTVHQKPSQGKPRMYRAQAKTGGWVYGNCCSFVTKDRTSLMTGSVNDEVFIINRKREWIEVVPKTVGMFTGYRDKNGDPIWEGDWLQTPPGLYPVMFGEYKLNDLTLCGFYLEHAKLTLTEAAQIGEVATCI